MAICVIALVMVFAAACSSSECDICEESGRLTTVDVMGVGELELCRDCAEAAEEVNEMFSDFAGMFD